MEQLVGAAYLEFLLVKLFSISGPLLLRRGYFHTIERAIYLLLPAHLVESPASMHIVKRNRTSVMKLFSIWEVYLCFLACEEDGQRPK